MLGASTGLSTILCSIWRYLISRPLITSLNVFLELHCSLKRVNIQQCMHACITYIHVHTCMYIHVRLSLIWMGLLNLYTYVGVDSSWTVTDPSIENPFITIYIDSSQTVLEHPRSFHSYQCRCMFAWGIKHAFNLNSNCNFTCPFWLYLDTIVLSQWHCSKPI